MKRAHAHACLPAFADDAQRHGALRLCVRMRYCKTHVHAGIDRLPLLTAAKTQNSAAQVPAAPWSHCLRVQELDMLCRWRQVVTRRDASILPSHRCGGGIYGSAKSVRTVPGRSVPQGQRLTPAQKQTDAHTNIRHIIGTRNDIIVEQSLVL